MMVKQNGGLDWSKSHHSRFEMTKSAILHLSRRTTTDPEDDMKKIALPRPPLILNGQVIEEVQSYKYLGIQIDTQLRWK
jgi:hypothetical protein